jgi:hypothetical protein
MKCRNCGHYNDADASFCEHCGANLNKSSMPTSTKMLIVVVIILVAGIGLVSGMMLMNNQAKPANNTSDNTTATDNSGTSSQSSQSSSQYKTFSNSVISFQYPSSWDVLPNGANTMVIVGNTNYPHFSVYDESKYGYKTLSDYVASSIKGMKEDGYTVHSQRNMTVDGQPATELIYQGDSKILHMVLVKSKGSYYALEGSDNANHYDQSKSIFNQIINSFQFL